MTSVFEGTRSPGRPRSESARRAILDAAMDLALERGLSAMSMDDIAQRAGVSKATIYRWWRSKERLTMDALAEEWGSTPQPNAPDTGSLREELLARFRPWIRQVNSKPFGRVVAGLVAEAQSNGEFATLYRDQFVEPRRAATRAVLIDAVDRGDISADTDLDVTLDLLYGPIYHRLLHGHAPLSEQFAEQVVDAVLAGIARR